MWRLFCWRHLRLSYTIRISAWIDMTHAGPSHQMPDNQSMHRSGGKVRFLNTYSITAAR